MGKVLSQRRLDALNGKTGLSAEELVRYKQDLVAAGYDVPADTLARRAWMALKTAGKTVARFGQAAKKHVAAGMPKPPPEVIEERRSICKSCPHWTGYQCKLCGCVTRAKTSWAGESCPDGRWQAWPVLSPDESAPVDGIRRENPEEPLLTPAVGVPAVVGETNLLAPVGKVAGRAEHRSDVGELPKRGE